MSKPKPKRKALLHQIALLRRPLIHQEYNTDAFRALRKVALIASGGEHLTFADWTQLSISTKIPETWRMLNQSNEILDLIDKDDPNVKV